MTVSHYSLEGFTRSTRIKALAGITVTRRPFLFCYLQKTSNHLLLARNVTCVCWSLVTSLQKITSLGSHAGQPLYCVACDIYHCTDLHQNEDSL
jgi:hypothetical protein